VKIVTKTSSNCFEIVRKCGAAVAWRKERARQFYVVGCSKVKLEQAGEVSCGKVCEEGLPKVKLEQEGEKSWEGSAKKVAEGLDASRQYVARVGLKLQIALAVGVWGGRAGGGAGNS